MANVKREMGDSIGGYTVVETLGQGGSGAVYLVRDGAGHEAALKLVDASADGVAAQRLEREVSALQSLRHPAVPQVIDAELDDDETFVVFDLVRGVSLFAYIQEHGPLKGDALADFAEVTASALEAVHAAGVVHRDVTPSNIMMGPDGPVLIDFGLSHRANDERLTRDGLVSGTAGYVAPEVIDGAEPGPIADRWAWAATVAYAMTGEAPFGSGTGAIGRTLEASPELPDVVGADAVAAALGRDIGARPGMRDVVAALRGATEVLGAKGGRRRKGKAVDRTLVAPGATAVMDTAVLDDLEEVVDEDYVDGNEEDGADADGDGEDWQEWSEQPADSGEWDTLGPAPSRRAGTIAVWSLAVAAAAALAPLMSFAAMVLFTILSRTAYRRAGALEAVRARRGARRSDAVVQTIGLPWHLLRAAGEVIPAALAAATLGTGTAALGWLLVSTGRVASDTAAGQSWGHAGALVLGAVVAAIVLWWGPWMSGTRNGAHRMTAALAPTRGVVSAWIVVALAGIGVVAVAVYVQVEPWWWPLPAMPWE